MKYAVILATLAWALTASAASAPPKSCAITYTVATTDRLGNVNEGAPSKLKSWLQKDMEKKYPDVCYAESLSKASAVLVITEQVAMHHGTRIVTTTDQQSGYFYGEMSGNSYSGTSTSSHAVPDNFKYGMYYLAIETIGADGKIVVRHRFEQDGIYHRVYGIPFGKGHHPRKSVLEEAIKWLHKGGLSDPLQSVAQNWSGK